MSDANQPPEVPEETDAQAMDRLLSEIQQLDELQDLYAQKWSEVEMALADCWERGLVHGYPLAWGELLAIYKRKEGRQHLAVDLVELTRVTHVTRSDGATPP